MALQAFFFSTLFMMALAIMLLGNTQFLVPYKALLLGPYAWPLLVYFAALYVNVFAAFYLITRHVFLKDTGRKLAHLEKQLRSGSGIAEELARRLEE